MFFRKRKSIKEEIKIYNEIIESQIEEVDKFFRMLNFFVHGCNMEYDKYYYQKIVDYSSKSCFLFQHIYLKSRCYSGLTYPINSPIKNLTLKDKTLIESYIYYQEKELEYLFKQCFSFIHKRPMILLYYIQRLRYIDSYEQTIEAFENVLKEDRIFKINEKQLKEYNDIMIATRKYEIRQIVFK